MGLRWIMGEKFGICLSSIMDWPCDTLSGSPTALCVANVFKWTFIRKWDTKVEVKSFLYFSTNMFHRFKKLMPVSLPSAAVAFCFPRNISVKAISRHSAMFPTHSNKRQRCEIDFEGALFLCQLCVFTRFYLINSSYGSNLIKMERLICGKWESYFRILFSSCYMKNITHFGAFFKLYFKVYKTAFNPFLTRLMWQCQCQNSYVHICI